MSKVAWGVGEAFTSLLMIRNPDLSLPFLNSLGQEKAFLTFNVQKQTVQKPHTGFLPCLFLTFLQMSPSDFATSWNKKIGHLLGMERCLQNFWQRRRMRGRRNIGRLCLGDESPPTRRRCARYKTCHLWLLYTEETKSTCHTWAVLEFHLQPGMLSVTGVAGGTFLGWGR